MCFIEIFVFLNLIIFLKNCNSIYNFLINLRYQINYYSYLMSHFNQFIQINVNLKLNQSYICRKIFDWGIEKQFAASENSLGAS